MLVATALLIIGLVLLVYGADPLVFSAAILCRSLGIPPLIISMMVVGIGTIYNMVIVLGIPALNLPRHARLRSFRP